ncbi:MAG: M28 family peptidase [Bacteroidetes bacterium]|nr:M28 family peptidase [Bacteroidota bacterium]
MRKIFFFACIALIAACGTPSVNPNPEDSTPVTPKIPRVKGPAFNADSTFTNIKTQVAFGPRVPDTKAHAQCSDYFIKKLKGYGLTVTPQITSGTTAIDNRLVTITNIFAQFHPERKDRILLLAHWDTRAFADQDPDSALAKKTFDGADDGASGAAVLLEIASVLQQKDPNIGVDLLFADAEDGGLDRGDGATWCVGTQYWAQHLPKDYSARYGILLDMVGGRGAIFPREGTGVYFAPEVVEKVWSAAAGLGYGNIFTNDITGQTTDDHLYVNQYARIPCIDIVHYNKQMNGYPEWHHRNSDNMEIIDPISLKYVGDVLVDVIYNEMPK